jgi:tRNA 2-thiouridine synthesizing protein A
MSAEVMTKRTEKIGLTKVDRQINLKGEVCPYTFVKSMLTLEEMEEGQVLQVIVDHLPAVENVPRSLTNEGYEILEVSQINETDWLITVKNVPWQE